MRLERCPAGACSVAVRNPRPAGCRSTHAQFANPAQVTTTAVAQLPRVRAPAARRARVENRHLASASRAALQVHDKGLGSRTASYGAAWQDNKSTHVTETVYWQVIVPTAPG